MELPALKRLLRAVADTLDEEISCDECFGLVAQYVDLALSETAAEGTRSRLAQHLRQCGVCREEYEILRDFVRLESDGEAPSVDDLRGAL